MCSEKPAVAGTGASVPGAPVRLTPAAMERVAANYQRLIERMGPRDAPKAMGNRTGTPSGEAA